MNTFSFRAELPHDVDAIVKLCLEMGYETTVEITPFGRPFPDVKVEMKTTATLEQLREVMDNVPDSHIPYQSLRQVPLKENSLERDHTLWPKWPFLNKVKGQYVPLARKVNNDNPS